MRRQALEGQEEIQRRYRRKRERAKDARRAYEAEKAFLVKCARYGRCRSRYGAPTLTRALYSRVHARHRRATPSGQPARGEQPSQPLASPTITDRAQRESTVESRMMVLWLLYKSGEDAGDMADRMEAGEEFLASLGLECPEVDVSEPGCWGTKLSSN